MSPEAHHDVFRLPGLHIVDWIVESEDQEVEHQLDPVG